MTNIFAYFVVAAVVIALAFIYKTARKREEKNAASQDRMNFIVRAPKIVRVASLACTGLFGIVFIFLLIPPGNETGKVINLVALAFVVVAGWVLYYSHRWKLVVAEDSLVLRPMFGKIMNYSVHDITRIETKSVYFIQVFGDKRKLFSAPGNSNDGVMLVSYFIEKGVKAPANITEFDRNLY